MRRPIAGLTAIVRGVFATAIAFSSAAAAPQADRRAAVDATAHALMDAFNKGDVGRIKSYLVADGIVIDDMPPFHWSGPGSIDAWLTAVAKDDAVNKDTEGHSVLGPPTFIRIVGQDAYGVFPDRFSYKRAGRQVHENGTVTFVFHSTGGKWRVVSTAYAADQH